MATAYFVDSSALVKRYVLETGTAWVRGITRRRSSTDIFIALITAVEVTSAIARRRGVTLSAAQASLSSPVPQAPGRALLPLADQPPSPWSPKGHDAGDQSPAWPRAAQLAAALDVYRVIGPPTVRFGAVRLRLRRPRPHTPAAHRRRADGRRPRTSTSLTAPPAVRIPPSCSCMLTFPLDACWTPYYAIRDRPGSRPLKCLTLSRKRIEFLAEEIAGVYLAGTEQEIKALDVALLET